jgi:putative transposase
VKQIQNSFGLSVRRACEAIGVARSTFTYKKKENEDYLVIDEIHRILSENSMYGCPMVHMKLRQRGLRINHKRTERIYKEQGLQLATRKRRKKIATVTRVSVETPDLPGVIWALDFMHDSIGFGRKFKILTAIDPAANYSPLIHSNFSITGKDVAEHSVEHVNLWGIRITYNVITDQSSEAKNLISGATIMGLNLFSRGLAND